jgi:hypothetical protein
MKPITSVGMEFKPTDLTLKEPCAARRLEGWPSAISPVAVLRDARKSALLRTRSIGDIGMIQTSENEVLVEQMCAPAHSDISAKDQGAGWKAGTASQLLARL